MTPQSTWIDNTHNTHKQYNWLIYMYIVKYEEKYDET